MNFLVLLKHIEDLCGLQKPSITGFNYLKYLTLTPKSD